MYKPYIIGMLKFRNSWILLLLFSLLHAIPRFERFETTQILLSDISVKNVIVSVIDPPGKGLLVHAKSSDVIPLPDFFLVLKREKSMTKRILSLQNLSLSGVERDMIIYCKRTPHQKEPPQYSPV